MKSKEKKNTLLKAIKSFFSNNLRGILGSLIFHLLILLLFFGLKISSLKYEQQQTYEVSFDETDIEEKLEEIKEVEKEKFDQEIREMIVEARRNIAVNEANNDFAKDLSTEEYINQLKAQLNITDPQELEDFLGDEPILQEEKPKPEEPVDLSAINYKGPTNISYFLENRSIRRRSVPVYKCQGNGVITINIVVDQKGEVVGSSVKSMESNDNECLTEAALQAAAKTLFNSDFNAPSRQKGTITYHFIAQ